MSEIVARVAAGLLAMQGVLIAFHASSPDTIPAEVMVFVGVVTAFFGAFALKPATQE